MSSESPSPVSPEIVRQIAALARIRVPEEELPLWTRQLARIVGYIDQLKTIPEDALPPPIPEPTPLRPDIPVDGHGLAALEANAPRLSHAMGVVPRIVSGRRP